MSARFRVRRTFILVTLRRFGPIVDIVALQLTKMVQKLEHDDALTWTINLRSNWARQGNLVL